MTWPILTVAEVEALEQQLIVSGTPLEELIARAVAGCVEWFEQAYPIADYPTVGLLVGPGHNGADALGIGAKLAAKGRRILTLVNAREDQLKPSTARALDEINHPNVVVLPVANLQWDELICAQSVAIAQISVWFDGLFGFGLNRPLGEHDCQLIAGVQACRKPIIALDLPSGLHGDFGFFSENKQGAIQATHTLALGCLKPVHALDTCLENLGRVQLIDMNYQSALLTHKPQLKCSALLSDDLPALLDKVRRPAASHKYISGRVLIVAGSKRYPGAALMSCMGATVSGAGMIHALIPEQAQSAVLIHAPEIIFEPTLPDLSGFDAIVLGPGWVPGSTEIFERVFAHIQSSATCQLVLDAGAFAHLTRSFKSGTTLNQRCVLTPHRGEFDRLFPQQALSLQHKDLSARTTVIEAVVSAAKQCQASVYLKGARSCVAHPDGSAQVVLESTPLLATAGHGDVLAGLLGGLLARGADSQIAAACAALLQSSAAQSFEQRHAGALNLTPLDLVHEIKTFDLKF